MPEGLGRVLLHTEFTRQLNYKTTELHVLQKRRLREDELPEGRLVYCAGVLVVGELVVGPRLRQRLLNTH